MIPNFEKTYPYPEGKYIDAIGAQILKYFKLYKCNYLQHSGGGGGGSPVAPSLHFESLERDPEVGAGFITVQKRPTGPSSALLIPTTLSTKGNSINATTGFFSSTSSFFVILLYLNIVIYHPKGLQKPL